MAYEALPIDLGIVHRTIMITGEREREREREISRLFETSHCARVFSTRTGCINIVKYVKFHKMKGSCGSLDPWSPSPLFMPNHHKGLGFLAKSLQNQPHDTINVP